MKRKGWDFVLNLLGEGSGVKIIMHFSLATSLEATRNAYLKKNTLNF